jgi:hypothetical protein
MPCARLKNVGQLYRATGLTLEPADAQALLFYCFIFGQSLLVSRTRPAQARAADRKVGRKTAGRRSLSAAGGNIIRPRRR